MADVTQGRRVPDGTDLEEYRPADYGRRGAHWWVCLPTGVIGRLDERWTITEHEDGTVSTDEPRQGPTITVNPSIFDSPAGWHGWLDHGVWREI